MYYDLATFKKGDVKSALEMTQRNMKKAREKADKIAKMSRSM